MEEDSPENVAVLPPYRNTSFLNIDGYLIKPNQRTPQNLSFSVACVISILSVINVILRKSVCWYRDGFSSIFRYFLQVVVVGSTVMLIEMPRFSVAILLLHHYKSDLAHTTDRWSLVIELYLSEIWAKIIEKRMTSSVATKFAQFELFQSENVWSKST